MTAPNNAASPATKASTSTSTNGCPVDHKNMPKEQVAAFMGQHHQVALTRNSPKKADNAETITTAQNGSSAASPCPVDHTNMSREQIAVLMSHHPESSEAHNRPVGLTPQNSASGAHDTLYDVYGQKLDNSNLMPATPNQLPSPGQRQPLSTDRVRSNIPKVIAYDGQSDTWLYPSPQMFFNALRRKGKAGGVEEADMPAVVAVHNRMNERTWEQVLAWEARFHCEQCPTPTLKRFLGRPNDLSPVARFRMFLRGYPRPFDRHDWIVDRCGKGDVRYVIDYYFHENAADPIEIHVRPALDTLSAAFDRFRAGFLFVKQSLGIQVPLPEVQEVKHMKNRQENTHVTQPEDSRPQKESTVLPPVIKGNQLDPKEFFFLTELTPEKVGEIADDIQSRCQKAHAELLAAASDPTKTEQANISLNYCMAQKICKTQARGFMAALEFNSDASEAYSKMTDCLDRFQIMARRALLDEAGFVQTGPEFPSGVAPSVSKVTTDGAAHAPAWTSKQNAP